MAGVARFLLAGGVSLAVHAALLVGTCGGWLAGDAAAAREEVDVAVQLEVGSVDLSVAEEEDASAPAAAQPVAAPSAPEPPPPVAVPEPPPLTAPPEPDAVVVRADDAVRPTALRPPEPEPPEPSPAARPPAPAPAPAAPPAVAAPVQARVDAPPAPRKSIKPKYPEGARRRGEQGDVVLELAVDARGGVADVKVVGGCGFAELEHAAVSAARRARFRPARRGGASVPSSARLTLTFRLRD